MESRVRLGVEIRAEPRIGAYSFRTEGRLKKIGGYLGRRRDQGTKEGRSPKIGVEQYQRNQSNLRLRGMKAKQSAGGGKKWRDSIVAEGPCVLQGFNTLEGQTPGGRLERRTGSTKSD